LALGSTSRRKKNALLERRRQLSEDVLVLAENIDLSVFLTANDSIPDHNFVTDLRMIALVGMEYEYQTSRRSSGGEQKWWGMDATHALRVLIFRLNVQEYLFCVPVKERCQI
jgi:hypothetical protein